MMDEAHHMMLTSLLLISKLKVFKHPKQKSWHAVAVSRLERVVPKSRAFGSVKWVLLN